MFPTGVGMNRISVFIDGIDENVPHRRGDEPKMKYCIVLGQECSPQAWG